MNKIRYFNESFVDRDFLAKIKNRKLIVIIEGEEIYINIITIPKVKNFKIYDLIKNELICKFNSIDNIIFDYNIIQENEISLEIIVYCVNIGNFHVLNDENDDRVTFSKVNLVQNYILSYLKRFIKEDNYFFVFRYKRNIYFLLVNKGNIIANKVIAMDNNLLNHTEELSRFIESYKEEFSYINIIYTVNLMLSNTQLEKFIVIKLKDIITKDFLNHIILKG
ncbi:hypothetical protein [Clostridium sp.]|uniref:hypothetical protein n=1 Tax=Clostridium sp. TaxID=1506 RepID=UPI002FC9123E